MEASDLFSKKLRIQTGRLLLRKITLADASDMFEYASKPETTEYLLWEPHPSYSYTAELIRHLQRGYSDGRYFDFALELKQTGKMIGTAGFTSLDLKNNTGEAGYVINPSFRNNGFATEALSAIINIAFMTLRLNRLEAKYIDGNFASLRVMKKCGMQFEGILRQKMLVKGRYRDIGICSLLREEYLAKPRESIVCEHTFFGCLSGLFHKN